MPRPIRLSLPVRPAASASLLALLLAGPAFAQGAEGSDPAQGDEGTAAGLPVETAEPNAADQEPAFIGQTRAPQPGDMPEVETEVVAEGLPQLWSMEFLPDGRMLVSAKEGAMHIVAEDGSAGPAIEGVPEVASAGQGGLLDLALSPQFEEDGLVFFSFAEPREGGNGTSVARGRLVMGEDATTLTDVSVIFRQMPTYDGDKHFGSRLVFDGEGNLFVTVGERSDRQTRVEAQDPESGFGKIFHITPDGSPAPGNPFAEGGASAGAGLPEVWSIGHRNLQAATLGPDGDLWTVEHGPRGGDELNRPEAGRNYGWPEVTYGIDYSGAPIGDGITEMEGTQQPIYYWDPVIAPSGMALYQGDEFPEWQDALLVGGLVSQGVVVLHVEDDRVHYEERVPLDARVRDVKVGPDGAVYAVTEDRQAGSSQILRLTSAGPSQ